MNELQLGLIGAGVMIVAGVMGYNAWQGARVRRKLPRTMPLDEESNAARGAYLDEESPFIDASHGPRRDPVFVQPAGAAKRVEPSFAAPKAAETGFTVPEADEPLDLAADSVPNEVLAEMHGPGPDGRTEPRHRGVAESGDTGQGPATKSPADTAGQREPTFGVPSESTPPHGVEAEVDAEDDVAGTQRRPSAHGSDAGANPQPQAPTQGKTAKSDARTEPSMMAAGASAAAPGEAAQHRPEAAAAVSHNAATPLEHERIEPVTSTISAAPPGLVDARIDCIVPIRLPGPVAGEKLVPLAQRLRRAGSKPVIFDGHPEGGAGWEALQAGRRYVELRAAVQLANRSGALNELEFSEFVAGVQQLSDTLDGAPELPDMMETVGMARELDAFAAQCDAQLSLNIMSDGAPWSANYVQAVASQDGLLLTRDGTRFVKLDARQNPVFMLQFGDTNFLRDDLTYKGGDMITLLLDVPVADEDILPFRLMCDYAASLSQRIGARVVDDQRRPLPETSLLAIDKQLMSLYGKLEAAGIPAGSTATRRLFSQ